MTGLSNRGFYSSRKDTQRVSIRLDTRRLVLNFVREQALRYSLGVTPSFCLNSLIRYFSSSKETYRAISLIDLSDDMSTSFTISNLTLII